LGYSKDDIVTFRSVASHEYPSVVPIIEEYLRLAERADTDAPPYLVERKRKSLVPSPSEPSQMHLFDLLRERRLFPSNSDLSEFAGKVLPGMSRHRFDKMSRGDIAARIIEFIERDTQTRKELEASMRDALASGANKTEDRKGFVSKWEKIIKGMQL
jgi:hypothetical protein